jgi:hypothetical protein
MDHTPIINWLRMGLDYWTEVVQTSPEDHDAKSWKGLLGWMNLMDQYLREHAPLSDEQRQQMAFSLACAEEIAGKMNIPDEINIQAVQAQIQRLKDAFGPAA